MAAPRRFDIAMPHEPGGGLSVTAWGEEPPGLVFLHANGFSGPTYRAVLTPLASHGVWAPDLRGHGRTRLSAETRGRRDWRDHARDVVALLDGIGAPVVLAGHSLGATTAALAAAERPALVRRLALIEPVVLPPVASRLMTVPGLRGQARRIPWVAQALNRRKTFSDAEAAMASYRGRGAFRDWPDEVLSDYVASAFLETEDGLVLACPPEWEASNYGAQGHDSWRALSRLRVPTAVLVGERGSTFGAPRWTLPRVTVTRLDGAGHMLPMTHGAAATAFLAEALGANLRASPSS